MDFYEIRSARVTDGDGDAGGTRRSFSTRGPRAATLFVWQAADGALQMVQLLVDESFVEWRHGSGVRAGHTNRHGQPDARGVRTLHVDALAIDGGAVAVLTELRLPDGLDDAIRAVFGIVPRDPPG